MKTGYAGTQLPPSGISTAAQAGARYLNGIEPVETRSLQNANVQRLRKRNRMDKNDNSRKYAHRPGFKRKKSLYLKSHWTRS